MNIYQVPTLVSILFTMVGAWRLEKKVKRMKMKMSENRTETLGENSSEY